MTHVRGALAALLLLILAGCAALGPATPAAVAPTLDGWRGLGLSCSRPTEDNVPSGLLQWVCRGSLRAAAFTAVLDGDDKGVFDITAQVPAGTSRETAVAAFVDLVDATTAVAAVRGAVRSWAEAWDGSQESAEFGITWVMLEADATWVTLVIWPGPRRSVGDPMP